MDNQEPPETTEVKCRKLLSKNKKIVLQWILGQCDISGNEKADPLELKVTLITQTTDRRGGGGEAYCQKPQPEGFSR